MPVKKKGKKKKKKEKKKSLEGWLLITCRHFLQCGRLNCCIPIEFLFEQLMDGSVHNQEKARLPALHRNETTKLVSVQGCGTGEDTGATLKSPNTINARQRETLGAPGRNGFVESRGETPTSKAGGREG